MGYIYPNKEEQQMFFTDGTVDVPVANLLTGVVIKSNLEDASADQLTLIEASSHGSREFTIPTSCLTSQQDTYKEFLSNRYYVSFKFVNHFRDYFSDVLQRLQQKKKVAYVHKSLGFYQEPSGNLVFLLESATLSTGKTNYHDPNFSFTSGVKKDFENFLAEEIIPRPEMQLALVFGLSSVLSSYIEPHTDTKTILLNACGASSTGKTTMAQFMASLWGNPKISNHGIVRTFNSTKGALLNSLEGINGVPIILDDSTTAQNFNKTALIYEITQGEGRQRLSNYGQSTKQGLPWSGLALITSETPIVSDAETRQGVRARVINADSITWTGDGAHATRIKAFIKSNYGHIGKEFVDQILNQDVDTLIEEYDICKKTVFDSMKDTDNLSERVSSKLAVVYQTAIQAEKILDIELDKTYILNQLIEFDQSEVERRSIGLQAIDVVKEFVLENFKSFEKYANGQLEEGSKGKFKGRIDYKPKIAHVIMQSETVRELLASNRLYEYDFILKYWGANKLIHQQSERNSIKHSAFQTRVVMFVFERSENSLFPWLYRDNKKAYFYNNQQKPPTSKIDYNKLAGPVIFEEDSNEEITH